VSNEFTSRYAGLSHRELWNSVQAGDPSQLDHLAAQWKSIAGTARSLAATVSSDLGKLDWNSDAGREFQRRLSILSTYSTDLADGHDTMHTGLTQMSQSLRKAKGNAEDPADTDDNDSALGFAAAGSVFGPAGTVVGGLLGHQRDEEQKKEAHDRMVAVVASLAADYEQYRFSYVLMPTLVPVDLPGPGTNPSSANPAAGPGVAGPHGGPGTHAAGTGPTSQGGPVTGTVAGPGSGTDQPANFLGSGTSLLGAGGAIAGAGAVGAGGLAAGGALASQLGAASGASATGFELTAGLAGAGMPVGGLVNQPPSANPAPAGGRAATGLRPGTSNAGGNGTGRAGGNGTGRAASAGRGPGSSVAGENARAAAGVRRGGSVEGSQRGAAGRTGEGHEDEEERYDTWLTEDEMVWGDDPNAAPPGVLGASAEPSP